MTTSIRLVILTTVAASLATAQSLDFATYKSKVEPIFLKKREGHARCVVCHAGAGNAFRLQPLAPGAKREIGFMFRTVSFNTISVAGNLAS